MNRDTAGALLVLDAHPLLREYFARELRKQRPEAWRGAHRRLYEHLCATTKDKAQPSCPRSKTGELHLIVDSTGLKLRGMGECLFEKHGTSKLRSWRKLHIGIDADSDEIVAFDLTDKEVDDASHVEPLLEQLDDAPASFMGDGAYDRSHVLDTVLAKNPTVRFIVSPCKGAMLGSTATTAPTQRDLHIRSINEHGRPSPVAANAIVVLHQSNQWITTDSALYPFVTHFFTRLPWPRLASILPIILAWFPPRLVTSGPDLAA